MIITKTPLRISFAGGGTDLAAFYEQEDGMVVSSAINLSIYLAVHQYFEKKIVLKYSKTEEVDEVCEIQHPLIRECMDYSGTMAPIEITSFADIPSKGSGLGSSSSFAVGLLKALNAHNGGNIGAEACASGACNIEIERLGEPIGKQDQYAAAFGGLNAIRFRGDGEVHVDPIIIGRDKKRELDDRLMMFYTGITRSASAILSEQKKNTENESDKFASLKRMRCLAEELESELGRGLIEAVGKKMHEGWLEKKKLANKISNPQIDSWYEAGMAAGATGGKILGAGGGGFMMFYCEPEKQADLRRALAEMREVPFELESQGSRILYVEK
jgi:D-glycero-alpha-D-manno-heptose-7-phosphate kinase